MPAYVYRSRIRELAVGQPIDAARATLGHEPVRKPNHPDQPFPSPLRALDLTAPDGRRIRVETYVVETWRASGCPDFHYVDIPVAFIDGALAAIGWDALEWQWIEWGGTLADLRDAQDRFACESADAAGSGSVVVDGLDEQREALETDDANP